MKCPPFAAAVWLCSVAGAFALGWVLKPRPRQSEAATAPVSASPVPPPPPFGAHRAAAADKAGGPSDGPVGALLTAESIARLGKAFRTATDPILKREAFARLLAGLTADNALEIREQIAHLDANDPAFRDFHFAWGKIGGLEAVLHGAETDKSDMGPTLAGWATSDPAAARAWYESLEETGSKGMNRDHLKESMVQGLTIADPSKAVDFVTGLGQAGDPKAKRLMSLVTDTMIQSGGPVHASEWALDLPQGPLRGHALADVARAMAREEPHVAAAWASAINTDRDIGPIVNGISAEWGSRNGAETVKWLDSLGGTQSSAYAPALAGWAKADPLAASQYLANMAPSDSRNQAIGGLISSYRWEDPVSSIAWANQITDPKTRQDVLTQTAEAYAKKDPAGAAAWLPNSGLPPETQQRLLGTRK